MGIFSTILSKLGFGEAEAAAPDPSTAAPAAPATSATSATSAAPTPISTVDVVSKLEGMAKANPEKLNWKTSIVDLMKLLGLESNLVDDVPEHLLGKEVFKPARKISTMTTVYSSCSVL